MEPFFQIPNHICPRKHAEFALLGLQSKFAKKNLNKIQTGRMDLADFQQNFQDRIRFSRLSAQKSFDWVIFERTKSSGRLYKI